jgi:signal transduction histidine kinase/CheY-like chemotaxis protein
MEKPQIPHDECERLAALEELRLLDTQAEARFDRISRIARRHFDVPTVLVSLVDAERQWIKSRHGFDIAQTHRDISFCGHTILAEDVFCVPNALQDPRFADNPLVIGPPHIRFYAGVPLRTLNGHRVGALCILDYKPRQMSSADVEMLLDLGAAVEEEIGKTALIAQADALVRARQLERAVTRAQSEFILNEDRHSAFESLLEDLLVLAESEYGFIGEILWTPEGAPYLKTYSITNIAWDEATRSFYDREAPAGMVFNNLHTLFGAAMTSGKPVIANEPGSDLRRGGLPHGHPSLDAFLGIPVYHGGKMVALFGLANRAAGYDQELIDFLEPLTATLGQLVTALRIRDLHTAAELRLEQLALEANEASLAKSRFVARVSHEVRTPLHAILGLAEMALQSGDASPAAQQIQIIRESAEYLLSIINDVLEFSRTESDGVVIAEQEFELADIVAWLGRTFRPMMTQKGIALSIEVDPAVLRRYRSDPLRLRQIITNLLSNAIKFTAEGEITVKIDFREHDKLLLVTVQDTGHGIDESDLEKLFEPFFQSSQNSSDQLVSGTGLGLPISRMLAHALGGEISVVSEPGHGSSFTLEIPLLMADAVSTSLLETPPAPVKPIPSGLKILLAEDNPVNQELIKAFLRDIDCNITCVNSGRAACAALEAVGMTYDLLLLDCDMPLMDGFEVARQVRASPGHHQGIVIMAVTAAALEQQRVECLEAGMDAVLSKPFGRTALLQMISTLLVGSETR